MSLFGRKLRGEMTRAIVTLTGRISHLEEQLKKDHAYHDQQREIIDNWFYALAEYMSIGFVSADQHMFRVVSKPKD